jgi:hypothetical protein
VALCKLKRKSHQNHKVLKRKKKEIKKFQQHLNSLDKSEELKTKLKDKHYFKESKNILLIILKLLKIN